jgi:uncharacterized protein YhfF
MAELESFSFGDSPELANELLELVLAGKKTATCWAASEGDKGVAIGKRWIVKDGQGRPSAILETFELARRRFGDVVAAFAHDEGEGDRSLEYWRQAHRVFHLAGRILAGHGALLRAIQVGRGPEAYVRSSWR